MQTYFLLVLYLVSLVLLIPVMILGNLLKPSKPKPSALPTPQKILEQIKESQKTLQTAKKSFEKFFLKADSCDEKLWYEMIDGFAQSKWLETIQVIELQNKIKEANPKIGKEIEKTISLALKNRK